MLHQLHYSTRNFLPLRQQMRSIIAGANVASPCNNIHLKICTTKQFHRLFSNTTTSRCNKKNSSDKVNCMRDILDQTSSSQKVENKTKNSWDKLWQKDITPWDIGEPTPVLISELEKLRNVSSSSSILHPNQDPEEQSFFPMDAREIRSFIPGCGMGYDLATIARYHDFISSQPTTQSQIQESTVIGLDISSTSLLKAKDTVSSILCTNNENQSIINSPDHPDIINESDIISTKIKFMHGDFFTSESDWDETTSLLYNSRSICCSIKKKNKNKKNKSNTIKLTASDKFDFIFDYTFFCAIKPELRSKWGKRMSTLLKPSSGRLLTLMFPTMVPPQSTSSPTSATTTLEGPPFPVSVEDYKSVLEPNGFEMLDGNPYEHEDTIGPRRGNEYVCWWKLR